MRMKLFLDTDIGDDIDDAWALAACISHPDIELVGVTTVYGDTEVRAALARLLLERAHVEVEVVAGTRDTLDRIISLQWPCYADVLDPEESSLRNGRVTLTANWSSQGLLLSSPKRGSSSSTTARTKS